MAEHENQIQYVAYDYYGDRKATYYSSDQYVKVWNKTKEGEWTVTSSLEAHSGTAGISKVTWAHPKYGQVLATCSSNGNAAVWEEIVGETSSMYDKSGTKQWVCRKEIADAKNSVTDVKFCPKSQGLQLATCSTQGIIRIYEAPNVKKLSQWALKHEIQCQLSMSCLDWSPSLSRPHQPMIVVGSGSDDTGAGGKVFLYEYSEDSKKWIQLDTIDSIIEPVHDVGFAPNLERSFHILGVATKNVRIFNLIPVDKPLPQSSATKLDIQPVSKFEEDDFSIRRICWNVAGTVLVSIGDDVCVRMIKGAADRAELCILPLDEKEA